MTATTPPTATNIPKAATEALMKASTKESSDNTIDTYRSIFGRVDKPFTGSAARQAAQRRPGYTPMRARRSSVTEPCSSRGRDFLRSAATSNDFTDLFAKRWTNPPSRSTNSQNSPPAVSWTPWALSHISFLPNSSVGIRKTLNIWQYRPCRGRVEKDGPIDPIGVTLPCRPTACDPRRPSPRLCFPAIYGSRLFGG